MQLADALLERRPFTHGDLSGANVKYSAPMHELRIIDFEAGARQNADHFISTMEYSAPVRDAPGDFGLLAQELGHDGPTEATDVYSWAAVSGVLFGSVMFGAVLADTVGLLSSKARPCSACITSACRALVRPSGRPCSRLQVCVPP